MPELADLNALLNRCGQSHLVDYLNNITPDSARDTIITQLETVEFESLNDLILKYVTQYQTEPTPSSVEPAKYYALDGDWDRSHYQVKGEELIRDSKIACFTVAGGQGSRLGFDGPKGCYPTSCVQDKSLFEIFAGGILATQKKYNSLIPWYIMTSPLNHEATTAFFKHHDWFGLDSDQIQFFQQGVMPSLNAQNGQILLADPIHLATNPDGHGGAYKALQVSGALDDMKRRGIQHMSYFQVDNPNVRVVDPVFIGLHAFAPDSSGEFSSKMVAKTTWDEKVGVFCEVDSKTQVIEYSDLPEKLARQTTSSGGIAYNAGSIALHMIGVDFIDRIVNDQNCALPFHRALKKVTHFDLQTGLAVEPTENNAVKLEKFVFDAIPIASKSIVVETDRVEEFAPVKNKTGNDSIESSKLIQTQRAARWLESAGCQIPRTAEGEVDAMIEIQPQTALCADDLRDDQLPSLIEPGSEVVL